MNEVKKLVEKEAPQAEFSAFREVYHAGNLQTIRVWVWCMVAMALLILFLPWTQNIRARGTVTTLRQEQRPQELNAIIGGRVVKWYVKEGDFVKAGDTIAKLAEIKDNYLDTNLILRTEQQIQAKNRSLEAYQQKVDFYGAQISAIERVKDLKIAQLQNKLAQLLLKVTSDSMEMLSAQNDFRIAEAQYNRQKIMRDSGLASLVQLEQRNQYYQAALAKKMSSNVKFTNACTDVINIRMELMQAVQEYNEKALKTQGERAAAQSDRAAGEAEVSKMNNQYANYVVRSGQYYLLAPQDGQVIQAKKSGINEIIKEGEKLIEIVPVVTDFAVEMFVQPMDMPLISKGQKVRFLFDGFPAIVFSGWPAASYGTFTGEVMAIESMVGDNGKFRVLVGEKKGEKPWPPQLKMGTGASGIALLKDVPVYYEFWRNISGFPPDYYQAKEKKEKDNDKPKGYNGPKRK